jgi:hypothetical protein
MFNTIRIIIAIIFASITLAFMQSRFKSSIVTGTANTHRILVPSIQATASSNSKKNQGPCPLCKGSGAVNCGPCKGTGTDKVNGNIFERYTKLTLSNKFSPLKSSIEMDCRWTCGKCKGFGLVKCSCNPEAGLTPEQK